MAYRRRRATRGRTRRYRKKRVYRKMSMARTRTRTRPRVNRRWRTYVFQRMCDMFAENEDPALSSPSIHVDSMGSVAPINNMCTPWVQDATFRNAPGCTSWTTGLIFKLNNLANVGEFINSGAPPAGLFEEYKIVGVKIEFDPYFKNKDLKTNTRIISDIEDDDGTEFKRTYPDPTIYYTTDHDGSNYLNWPMIQEMGGIQRFVLNKPKSLYIRPTPVRPIAVTGAGGSVFSATGKAPWITNKNIGIEHYGLRLLITDWPGPSDSTGGEGDALEYGIRIRFRYIFKVRGTI